jgi:hypothetical protein
MIKKVWGRVYDWAAARVVNRDVGYEQVVELLDSVDGTLKGEVEQGIVFGDRRAVKFLPLDVAIERFRAYYHHTGGSGHHNAYRVYHHGEPLIEHHIRFRRTAIKGHEEFRAGAFMIFRVSDGNVPNRRDRNP